MSETILETIRRDGFSFEALAAGYPELLLLKQVPQNPAYHAEGDVYCHTGLVCEALLSLPEWRTLNGVEQELLFLAAAFHDIGKITCTKYEDGIPVSPKHTISGSKLFRRIAYREAERFSLSFSEREFVANAIRYHGLPVWFFKNPALRPSCCGRQNASRCGFCTCSQRRMYLEGRLLPPTTWRGRWNGLRNMRGN